MLSKDRLIFMLVVVLLFIYLYYDTYKQEYFNNKPLNINKYFKNYKMNKQKVNNDDKIFISIASYRDPQLIHTLNSIIDNCSDTSKIRIVVCEQNHDNDDFNINKSYINTEIIKMKSTDARGPCWARYLIQQCWKGEQYYLQIDSHTRFVKNWDIILRNEINMVGPLSCLSNYVSTFDINTGNVIKSPLRGPMYVTEIDPKDGFPRFNSSYVKENTYKTPPVSKGWSGCFSFSSSQLINDAPYDPNTPFLFFGEEIDIYTRLHKHGWTMYVPTKPICFTLFDRSYRKTFWEHPDCKLIAPISRKRVHNRLLQ